MAKLIGQRTTKLSQMAHVIYEGRYYIISQSFVADETLIFKSNENGDIVSYCEVGTAENIQDGIDNFKNCIFQW